MTKLKEILDVLAKKLDKAELFYGHGTDNAWDEAVQLVLYAMQLPANSGEEVLILSVSDETLQKIEELLEQRMNHQVPLPYLTKEAYFAGLKFYVDKRVIIPRSPFAELILDQFEPWVQPDKVTRILDLCTGGGCMAIAAALSFPESQVDALDISEQALEVAKINVDNFDLNDRVKLIQSDGFNSLVDQKYDIIMSNPPYVSEQEMSTLPNEYAHEPTLALEAEEQGLKIVSHILENADRFLNADAILVVEVGNSEAALLKAYPKVPFTWLEFSQGGHGVFLLTKKELENVRK